MSFIKMLYNKIITLFSHNYMNHLKMQNYHLNELLSILMRHIDIKAFEVRQPEIENSNSPIVGNFYVYNEKVIPNYLSESLYIDGKLSNMKIYPHEFYQIYMVKKYKDLPDDPNQISSGISRGLIVFLDERIFDNDNIRNDIIRIYRLDKNVLFLPGLKKT